MEEFPNQKITLNGIKIPKNQIDKESGERIWRLMQKYEEMKEFVESKAPIIREAFGADSDTPVSFEDIGKFVTLQKRQYGEGPNTTPVTAMAGSNTDEDGSGEYAQWQMISMPFDADFNKLVDIPDAMHGDESDTPPEGTAFLAETSCDEWERRDEYDNVIDSKLTINPISVYKIE
ncbi:MAG: hypothetical protein LBL08_03065 [Candidatus Nomurabacteria bacterium]|jgi:hypothetical protein|nr:hypothetical protein [Candidatus Nomurabacteria bacterium]